MANTPALRPNATPSTHEPANDFAKASRLRVLQSNGYSLIVNSGDESKIRDEAIRLSDDILLAYAGWLDETRSLANQDDVTVGKFMNEQLNGVMKLMGGGWHPDQRSDWVEEAYKSLAEVPYLLLMKALPAARKVVYNPSKMIPWVFENIDPALTRLKNEGWVLSRFIEIGGLHFEGN